MSNAGKYRERVTFYTPGATVSDGAGGQLPAGPETSLTLWARVQALPAKEDLISGKIVPRQPYKVTIRYASSLSNSTRMECNGKHISVTSIVSNERTTEIYLYGVECDS
ncbi:hypothetical protein AUC43_15305 [Hymenobacter sedentarius]|uniref:Head-tail adaptor protein n=1 Tax=Hymenobacter sedentarius TaxID=1411621 RepID=A0A0U4BRI0_9BACT|nr:phage head closure protein [Hymenobacter sedentarius]ALW86330.1 hypothetical protein AUC43_15305 [Hymenobacter sedentarius]